MHARQTFSSFSIYPHLVYILLLLQCNEYESVSTNLASIRPGKKVGDPTETDIRRLQYLPDRQINFNFEFDSEWTPLPQRNAGENKMLPKKLYKSGIPITKTKYDQLQELKPVIEREHHDFYDKLPYAGENKTMRFKTKL